MTRERTKIKKYDYGECEICNTALQERLIKQDFWIRDRLIVVENVPAGVCPQCGEKVVKANVGQWLMGILHDSKRLSRAKKISVPSIPFSGAEARV